MQSMNIADIAPDQYRLGANVVRNNMIIAKAGMLLTQCLLQMIKNHHVKTVYVLETTIDIFNISDYIDNTTYMKVKAALKDLKNIDALRNASKSLTSCIMKSSLLNTSIIQLVAKQHEKDSLIEHSIGVACYAGSLAAAIGLNQTTIYDYVVAGLLHDIGKTAIPDKILFSPYNLTLTERAIMRQHPVQGYAILREYDWLKEDIKQAVLQHHENYDGTGYPSCLSGGDINDIANALHIADVYDALTRARTYKKGWQPRDAYDYIISESGKQFDPKYVEIFKDNVPLYDVGTLIRMSNNKLAVVLKNIQSHTSTPIVIPVDGTEQLDLSKTDMTVSAQIYC